MVLTATPYRIQKRTLRVTSQKAIKPIAATVRVLQSASVDVRLLIQKTVKSSGTGVVVTT